MDIRLYSEQLEKQTLSPFAALSGNSAGREHPITECDMRTCYQRDRDRIIHCKSFRRLKYKTQVFLAPVGDHYRTRLTHTLEVAQVARTIARCLRLNEDLTEAIALGHDLGHTPFGHIGERTLDRLMPEGFRHNEQSLRVVRVLEKDGKGLNLCRETMDGILTHSGKQEPITLEGSCVRRADRIAYINHDIDDAIRGGILKPTDLPARCLKVLGDTHGQRIETMIRDIVTESWMKPCICMSEEVEEAADELRTFLFDRVYNDSWRSREEKRCDSLLEKLFEYFMENPSRLPPEYIEICYTEGSQRAVCDYIACMTDRFAMDTFREIYLPEAFAVK